MRRLLPLFLLAVILFPAISSAEWPILEKKGEPLVTMDLELRPRWELDGRDFNDDSGFSDYGTMRTMIGINVRPMDDFMVRLNVQESRYLGTQLPEEAPTSEWDMREAYFRVDNLFDKGVAIQAGRFTWSTGRGRIFGRNDWPVLGPNAYDGILLESPCWLMPDKGRWSLLFARVQDYDYPDHQLYGYYAWDPYHLPYDIFQDVSINRRDRNLIVFSGNYMDGLVQPFISADIDTRDESAGYVFVTPLTLYHAGFYSGGTWDQVTFNVDAVYQWGEMNDTVLRTNEQGQLVGEDNLTMKSWLLAADVAYQFDLTADPTFKLGLDMNYGSWDFAGGGGLFSPNYSNIPHFQTPFASKRDFRGLLNVDWSVYPQLSDYFASFAMKPYDNVRLETTYHRFISVQEGASRDETIDLGHEVDLDVTWHVNDYLALNGGFARFTRVTDRYRPLVPQQTYDSPFSYVSVGQDGANYAWLTATVRF